MGMLGLVAALTLTFEFESPNVVPDICPRQQTYFREVYQVTIDGRSVKSLIGQYFKEFGMAHWRRGCLQVVEHCHAGSGAP